MAFFPSLLSREESDRLAQRIDDRFNRDGFSLCAVEVKGGPAFIGFVGLNVPTQKDLPFLPAIEVGWRLARDQWSRGYATEAARACLGYGFTVLQLGEIVAYAVASNRRSLAVMERIGMQRDPDGDFDHSAYPAGHRLARHVLYRIAAPGC